MTLKSIAAVLGLAFGATTFAQEATPPASDKPAARKGASRTGAAQKAASAPSAQKDAAPTELPPLTDEAARAQAAAPQCQIKPVMSDEEIDRCRPRRR
jgi:hypothetical protein